MKVFISWSGDLSHKVAIVIRDWLPSVIQSIEPYVSSEDIEKGVRWSSDVSGELQSSNYGILCITPENISAPWLNFEAGALSKSMENSRVVPFLFMLKRSEVQGPLLQFQSTIFDEDDVRKLVHSINNSCPPPVLDDARLDNSFVVWWPLLKSKLDQLSKIPKEEDPKGKKTELSPKPKEINQNILEEVLELVRNQQKLLTNPEQLFPAQYLRYILREMDFLQKDPGALRAIISEINDLFELIYSFRSQEYIPVKFVADKLFEMMKPLDYLLETNKERSALSNRMKTLSELRLEEKPNISVVKKRGVVEVPIIP